MSRWYKQLFQKSKAGAEAVLGISLTPDQAVWCLVQQAASGPQITQSHSIEQSFTSPADALAALRSSAPLPAAPCYICLGHQYYNLLLVDAPDVPDQELREAVRWKVKDLIHQAVDDMVMDAFRLPEDAYRGRMNMLYVAAIERALIQGIVEQCDQHNINLQEITINELAMAALASALTSSAERGAAFLYLNGDGGTINLIENGYLYLTRTIELGSGGGVFTGNLEFQQEPVDNLALDVQRSLDYYESQIGKSGIGALYMVSNSEAHNAWCEGLSERLPISAEQFSVEETLKDPGWQSDTAEGPLAPAMGAALGGLREYA
ncbi:MAG TPA: hypothetical protein DEP79_10195 [Gammaproteobacteria bacterium]|nr:hypothetical protein [Gammaproteobacteria bacterium]